jgi:hypothetical protein
LKKRGFGYYKLAARLCACLINSPPSRLERVRHLHGRTMSASVRWRKPRSPLRSPIGWRPRSTSNQCTPIISSIPPPRTEGRITAARTATCRSAPVSVAQRSVVPVGLGFPVSHLTGGCRRELFQHTSNLHGLPFPLPVAVGTPRSFNAFEMPLSDVMPAACTALMTGPRSAACRRALSALLFLPVGRTGGTDVAPGIRMRVTRVGQPRWAAVPRAAMSTARSISRMVSRQGICAFNGIVRCGQAAPAFEGDRTADRHRHGGGKCVLDITCAASARRDRPGQGRGRLQGPGGFDRCDPGARNEDRGQRSLGDREGAQDRQGVGLSGAGSRLMGRCRSPGSADIGPGGVSPAPSFDSINPT